MWLGRVIPKKEEVLLDKEGEEPRDTNLSAGKIGYLVSVYTA